MIKWILTICKKFFAKTTIEQFVNRDKGYFASKLNAMNAAQF